MESYSDPRFGVRHHLPLAESGALNGTVGATELMRYTMMHAGRITDWNLRIKVGGTEASVRQVLLGISTAGTGATTNIGTQALGTLANNTVVDSAVTATNFDEGDDVVVSHLGTGAGVYNVQPVILYNERFVAG